MKLLHLSIDRIVDANEAHFDRYSVAVDALAMSTFAAETVIMSCFAATYCEEGLQNETILKLNF